MAATVQDFTVTQETAKDEVFVMTNISADDQFMFIVESDGTTCVKKNSEAGGADDEISTTLGTGGEATVSLTTRDTAGLSLLVTTTYQLFAWNTIGKYWEEIFKGTITVEPAEGTVDTSIDFSGAGILKFDTDDITDIPDDLEADMIMLSDGTLWTKNISGVWTALALPYGTGGIAALAGTNGTPSDSNRFVTDTDPRNTNTRTPTAGSVIAASLATNAVETLKIKDLNVTYAKLSSYLKEFLVSNGYSSEDLQLIPHNWLPNNYAIIDKNGKAHQMVEIPRKNWDVANGFAGATIHPAFTVDGAQKRIFIGKYQASMDGAYYVTKANAEVKHSLTFDQELAAATALNGGAITGFHLMTNAEWALVALLSHNGLTMPYGNNNYGRDIDDKSITGVFEAGSAAVWGTSGTARTKTGSMGVKSSHNHQESGIYDLNGNVWERVSGLRLNTGEINILANNNAAVSTKDQTVNSAEWKAILGADGTLVAPGTAGTVKIAASGTADNTIVIASGGSFAGMTNPGGTPVSAGALAVLKAIALYPHAGTGLGSDGIWHASSGEYIPIRGGTWNHDTNAGVFSLLLINARSVANANIGFRFAFYL